MMCDNTHTINRLEPISVPHRHNEKNNVRKARLRLRLVEREGEGGGEEGEEKKKLRS